MTQGCLLHPPSVPATPKAQFPPHLPRVRAGSASIPQSSSGAWLGLRKIKRRRSPRAQWEGAQSSPSNRDSRAGDQAKGHETPRGGLGALSLDLESSLGPPLYHSNMAPSSYSPPTTGAIYPLPLIGKGLGQSPVPGHELGEGKRNMASLLPSLYLAIHIYNSVSSYSHILYPQRASQNYIISPDSEATISC